MPNALILPLLLLLGLVITIALVVRPRGPRSRWYPRGRALDRVRSALGLDDPVRRQKRVIQAIALGVPRRAERTTHSRVLPPRVRVGLHPDDFEPIVRNRSLIERELNDDWWEQAEREGWEMSYVEIEPVLSSDVRPGRVELQLIYDGPTPRHRPRDRRDGRAAPGPGHFSPRTRSVTLTPPGGPPVTLDGVGQSVTAGRRPTCELVIDHEYASKVHAVFVLREDGLLVRDNGSANGTVVDGRSITELVVTGNAEVRLGRSEPIRLTWS